MKSHLKEWVGFAPVFLLPFFPSLLWAMEEGQGGHEAGSSHLWGLVFPAVNFLLFVFVLRKYALPAVQDALRQRQAKIVAALDEAKRAKEEAESLKRDYERKLAGLAEEQQKVRAQALESAERERQRIIAEAQQLAERMKNEVQHIAQRELEEARRVLRKEVSEQAIVMATELLQSRLTPADHSRFVQDFVTEVQNAAVPSR
ncbi:MAG: F0F1 ATP synthase subunit B [Candidatus Binatia bacterium]